MDDDYRPGRGGSRARAGRPRGTRGKHSKENAVNEKVAEVCQTLGIEIHPTFKEMNPIALQVFVMRYFASAAMNAPNHNEQLRLFSSAASVGEKVAPFLFAKMASVTQEISIDTDMKKLSTAELKARAAAVLDADFELIDDADPKLLGSS